MSQSADPSTIRPSVVSTAPTPCLTPGHVLSGGCPAFSRRYCKLKTQSLERRLVAAPVRPHLDDELEIHLASEQRFDLRPGPRADLPDHRAALADEDLLLGVRLDEQVRAQHLLVELVDLDRGRVPNLVPRQPE